MCVRCSRHVLLLMRVYTVYIKRRRHTQPSNQHNPWKNVYIRSQPPLLLVSVHIYYIYPFPSHYTRHYRLCLWPDCPVISSDWQASERKNLNFINDMWLFYMTLWRWIHFFCNLMETDKYMGQITLYPLLRLQNWVRSFFACFIFRGCLSFFVFLILQGLPGPVVSFSA